MKRQPLRDGWSFLWFGDAEPDLRSPDAGRPVSLPHTFASDGSPRHGRGLYRTTVPADPSLPETFVEFGAADQCCTVYINGKETGSHQGGYSRFRVQVPAEAVRAGSFELGVLVDNRLNEHVNPHFGDFTVVGGLPRMAYLVACEASHFDRLYYGTDGVILRTEVTEQGDGLLTAEFRVIGGAYTTVRLTVTADDGTEAASAEQAPDGPVSVLIRHPRLWNGRSSPALYRVCAELLRDGRVLDSVVLETGFRKIAADGNGFRLNGKNIFLRGTARHQDRAGIYTAENRDTIREDFDLLDELGANAVRLSHYQHPQAAYEECDRRGILCWAEIPMLKMTGDPQLMENARQQLTELILQNIHHPSVFCWGIQNEIAMFRDAPFMHEGCRELHALAHRLDPGRMTACANLFPVAPQRKPSQEEERTTKELAARATSPALPMPIAAN